MIKTHFPCPFCGNNCIVKASRQPGKLLRYSYMECTNSIECGWRTRFNFEYSGTLQESHLGRIENGNVILYDVSKNPDHEILSANESPHNTA